ncbi:MAG: alpha/beta-hydrolase family protein [Acidimicrobiia bacterium]
MTTETDATGADAGEPAPEPETPGERAEPVPPMRLRQRLFHRPRLGGLVVAIVFFWESLSPTLLPRSMPVQALLTGACTVNGYAVGASVSVVVGWILDARGKGPLPTKTVRLVVYGIGAVVVVIGAFVWATWQNEQRDLVEMPHILWTNYFGVLVIGAIIGAILFFAGRFVGHGVVLADRALATKMPDWAAVIVTAVLITTVIVVVTRDFVLTPVFDKVNDVYGTVDDTTEAGVHRPHTSDASGGPGSLVPWNTLGMQGRTFTGGVTTRAELETLVPEGTPVQQPIRVYVGLQSADDAKARAKLAVQELDRTDAWSRRVLVVGTATGTGWINPEAARAYEALNAGDTAFVTMQYSYLPSWISFLVDGDVASEAGRELFDAVRARWLEQPEATRPKLIVFGESLGSFGSEHAFLRGSTDASVAAITKLADGALWVGPTEANPIRTPLIEQRNSGSPTWLPKIGNGRTVVFTNSPDELTKVDGQPVVYLQHPSDPVGWWGWSAMWSKPLWLQGPRGYDVPERAHWFPFVTWAQSAADLIAGFSAPSGYGHNYNNAWPQAWAAVAAPPGWTDADTKALALELHTPKSGG